MNYSFVAGPLIEKRAFLRFCHNSGSLCGRRTVCRAAINANRVLQPAFWIFRKNLEAEETTAAVENSFPLPRFKQ